MSVTNMTIGAATVTTSGATVAVKATSTANVRIAVSTNAGMTSPTYFGPVAPDATALMAKVAITGLAANTRHWFQAEHNSVLDTTYTGQFLTLPAASGSPASFIYGCGACAGGDSTTSTGSTLASNRVSNASIFSTIMTAGLAANWLGFVHLGDLHYYDLGSGSHGIAGAGSLSNYRRGIDDVLLQPNQHLLYHRIPWAYVMHDHDWCGNNTDSSGAGRANCLQVYREKIPHGTLQAGGTTHVMQSWQVGRVLNILTDDVTDRTNAADTTMLGATQLSQLDTILSASTAEALIWWMPDQWLAEAGNTYSWSNYPTEQQTVIDMLTDTGFINKMVMVQGDAHALAIDTGGNAPGGFPVLMCTSLDSDPSSTSYIFDTGRTRPARNQYGTVRVDDDGDVIAITLTGWRDTTAVMSYTHWIGASTQIRAGSPSHVLAL